jgi:gamma-glutamylputrescine oxidase
MAGRAAAIRQNITGKLLLGSAAVAATTWPVAARIFPEQLEVDENVSYWAAQTPDYWAGAPLRKTITADLAIIGGGFTGVSMAYHFSRRYPGKRVVLLEAKSLANGASGRNGGMVLNWINGVDTDDPAVLNRVYQATSGGINLIEEIIQRHNLPVDYRRDGTVTVYTSAERAENAHAEIERLNSIGIAGEFFDRQTLAGKLNMQGVYGAWFDPGTGQMNGAQLVRSLRPILLEQGVEIYENTPVLKVREESRITLVTPEAEVKANAIVLATNGYTGKLGYFREAVFPLHSHVFATEPLTPAQREALGWHALAGYSDDLDRISYSTMTRDGRLIFGGGSNQSYSYLFKNRTAYPGTPDSTANAFAKMRETLREYFPNSADLKIAYKWTGTLAITLRRNCSMGVRGENRNVYYALGYSGHGVTLANLAGQVLTDIYSGDDQQWRDLPFYQAKFAAIPPEPFRWMGYQAFTRFTGRSPRV